MKMDALDTKILINELQKLVVDKQRRIEWQDLEITSLKNEVKRLEELLTPTIKESDKALVD